MFKGIMQTDKKELSKISIKSSVPYINSLGWWPVTFTDTKAKPTGW